jgi:hypothetical protein
LLLAGLAADAAPLLQRLEDTAGPQGVRLLLQWLGPYPMLDYSLVDVHTDWARTCATVRANGPDGARIQEPITVALKDRTGVMHQRTRLGPGPVIFEAPGPMKALELDPDERLVERHNPPRLQARYNNRQPKRYRLLLNDLSATLDVTGQALTANVDVRGRRLYDLRHDAHLGAFFGPYSYGVLGRWAEHFGRELTPLKLAHAVAVEGGWSRLRAEPGAGVEAGQLWTVGLGYHYDSRISRITAWRGAGVDAAATAGFTHPDGRPGLTPWLSAGLSGLKLVPLGRNQALLLRLRGDHIVGAAPPQAQLRLGGRYLGARGFQMGEAFGPTRLLASAEYRHVLVGDSRTDLWGLVTLTAVEGAAFADGLYMPHLRPASYGTWLGDVGYGVRVMGDVLGVSPTSLAVDVALPLGRRGGSHLPVTVYVAFVQSFLAF